MKGTDKGSCEVEECKSIYQNALSNNELNFMRIKHVNKLILAHLNINSQIFVEFVKGKVDILMISEKKLRKACNWANLKQEVQLQWTPSI